MYAIIITTKEVRNKDNRIVQHSGIEYLIIKDKDGWVPATIERHKSDNLILIPLVKLFRTPKSATNFISKWEGYPWYIKVKSYRIISVRPTHKKVLEGYLINH